MSVSSKAGSPLPRADEPTRHVPAARVAAVPAVPALAGRVAARRVALAPAACAAGPAAAFAVATRSSRCSYREAPAAHGWSTRRHSTCRLWVQRRAHERRCRTTPHSNSKLNASGHQRAHGACMRGTRHLQTLHCSRFGGQPESGQWGYSTAGERGRWRKRTACAMLAPVDDAAHQDDRPGGNRARSDQAGCDAIR